MVTRHCAVEMIEDSECEFPGAVIIGLIVPWLFKIYLLLCRAAMLQSAWSMVPSMYIMHINAFRSSTMPGACLSTLVQTRDVEQCIQKTYSTDQKKPMLRSALLTPGFASHLLLECRAYVSSIHVLQMSRTLARRTCAGPWVTFGQYCNVT
jgi:hypothetical protein